MLDERFSRRQAGHAHAAGGAQLAMTLHACLCEDRTDGGVELVGLAADACGREQQARADGGAEHAAPPRRRACRAAGGGGGCVVINLTYVSRTRSFCSGLTTK